MNENCISAHFSATCKCSLVEEVIVSVQLQRDLQHLQLALPPSPALHGVHLVGEVQAKSAVCGCMQRGGGGQRMYQA